MTFGQILTAGPIQPKKCPKSLVQTRRGQKIIQKIIWKNHSKKSLQKSLHKSIPKKHCKKSFQKIIQNIIQKSPTSKSYFSIPIYAKLVISNSNFSEAFTLAMHWSNWTWRAERSPFYFFPGAVLLWNIYEYANHASILTYKAPSISMKILWCSIHSIILTHKLSSTHSNHHTQQLPPLCSFHRWWPKRLLSDFRPPEGVWYYDFIYDFWII